MDYTPACVSLDQNFLWNFSTRKDPVFASLHDSIVRAVMQRKVICPIHVYETIIESSATPSKLQHEIFRTARKLSGSRGFHHFETLLGFETLRLIRPDFSWAPLQAGILIEPDATLAETGGEYRKLKQDYAARLASTPSPPPTHNPKTTVDQMEQELDESRAAFMYQLVQSIRDKRSLETGLPQWEHTDAAGQYLLANGITPEECGQLLLAIIDRRWNAIPVLHAHTRLCACLEYDYIQNNRPAKANDAFDISRLAVALVQADAIFCDHAMAVLIDRAEIRNPKYGSRVFSRKRAGDAVAYLNGLCGG